MATEVLYSKPICNTNLLAMVKLKKYKLITEIQKRVIEQSSVYAFYNDEEHPLLLMRFPKYPDYTIGYEFKINDIDKTVTLKYVDASYRFVFLPTENDFSKVKAFYSNISRGNNILHDLRNQRTYVASAIRALYVDKSMWINNNGFYDIYCDIMISGKTHTFGIYKKFLGMNQRQLFYIVDELDDTDCLIMKNNLLRVYPSNQLGMNKYNKEIILDSSAVFILTDPNLKTTAFDEIKEEYLDTVHNLVEAKQQNIDLIIAEKDSEYADEDCPF
jgi:hypothetical protein